MPLSLPPPLILPPPLLFVQKAALQIQQDRALFLGREKSLLMLVDPCAGLLGLRKGGREGGRED
jgi:hypothetical protein